MNQAEFKNKCPNMFNAMQSNQKQFELYGIKFKSHTVLKWHRIVDTVEDPRAFCFFKFSFENKFVLFVLN